VLGEIEWALGRAVPDWEVRYRGHLHAVFEAELTAVDGIHGALKALRCSTCVASSGTHEKMRLTLGLTGLLDHFRGRIYSVTEVGRGKPAPDLFLHAAERSGVPPERCVVVEDSRSGVAAARAAGMRSLGYAGGLTPPAESAAVHIGCVPHRPSAPYRRTGACPSAPAGAVFFVAVDFAPEDR
jgi:HAD superfamily hydrolase (TIGR01509 family)